MSNLADKVLIIFHKTDFDGKCSAAIAEHAYKGANFYGWNHYERIDWELIRSYDIIIMVDIAFPNINDMLYLKNNFVFFWIDHHIESIKRHGDSDIMGLQEVGKGACELCWEYFFPQIEIPRAVKLLADYDIWNHTDKHTLPFQYGMRYVDVQADDTLIWRRLFNDLDHQFQDIYNEGKICFDFELTQNIYKAKSSYEVEFQGHQCIALNSPPNSSLVFDSVDGRDYDIQIIFGFSGDTWKITMYQDNGRVNVGEIATYFGGGGHFSASGFKCTTEQIIELGLVK